MEYIHTVLAQVSAGRADEIVRPGGLLHALDEHRTYLDQQPGFQDMRVTRSINREGQIQVVVETRWADEDSLVRYETREPNIRGIISSFSDIVQPDSIQVMDMEALRAEPRAVTAGELRDRLALPLIMPAGILAFALLVIYALSRVYLDVDKAVATPLAAGIAGGIFVIAWFVATNPRITGVHVMGIMVIAAAALVGGVIFAHFHDEGGTQAEASATETPAAAANPNTLQTGDNFFLLAGKKNPTLTAAANQQMTLTLNNSGTALHNMRIAGPDGKFNTADDVVSSPEQIPSKGTATVTFQLPAGTYDYECEFHVAEMKGKLEVK